MMNNIIRALNSLAPGSVYTIRDNKIQWLDTEQTQPTEAEIQAEIVRLTEEYNATEYQRLRKAEYDKLNQDELRFDDLINNTTTWQDAILAIKAKYPKPTEGDN